MAEDEQKAAFAAFLLKKPDNAFEAALQVFGNDTGAALRASQTWPNDPIVIAEKARLLDSSDEGELSFLPTKADLARKIWDRMDKPLLPEEFAKIAKLYAEVRGFIAKPETNVTVNNQTNNKVMVVKDMGSDAEWEAKSEKQQRDLLNVARTRH